MNIIGTMRALDETSGAVRVEDVYDTDIDDLWEACTTPERLARWIAEVSGDLRVGGTIHAVFTSTWTGPGRVEVCEAPHHLLLTMEPGTDDESQMEAWLTEEGSRTRLVVEERGLPVDTMYLHGAGWQAHLEDLGRSLAEGTSAHPASAGELAEALPIARPGVSRHLRVLREAGLIEVRREAQRRIYSLRPEALIEVDEWLAEYRVLWQTRLDALQTEIARGKKART